MLARTAAARALAGDRARPERLCRSVRLLREGARVDRFGPACEWQIGGVEV